jgi:hypothetical protein
MAQPSAYTSIHEILLGLEVTATYGTGTDKPTLT